MYDVLEVPIKLLQIRNQQREISEKLDISEKTVENQMTKALKMLRDALSDYTALSILLVPCLQ